MKTSIWSYALFCFFVLLSTGRTSSEVAAKTLSIPVDVWTNRAGETTNTVSLNLPEVLDERGTLTLVIRGDSSSRLITLYRDRLPETLHFLFGESDRLHLRILDPEDLEYKSENAEFEVALPYDQLATEPRNRHIRFVDAADSPLTSFRLQLGLSGRFGAYTTELREMAIPPDGIVILPQVIDPNHSMYIHRTQPAELYQLYLTDLLTSQSFPLELMQLGSTALTTVYLPTIRKEKEGIAIADGIVLNHDGTAGRPTTITLIRTYVPPTRSQIMSKYDPAKVYVTKSVPAPDGRFRIAVSSPFNVTDSEKTSMTVHVEEQSPGLFMEQIATLAIGASNVIKLPKRLWLAARLIDHEGNPVNVEDWVYSPRWIGIRATRLNQDCRKNEYDLMPFRDASTTGSTFLLRNLAVPDRIQLECNGTIYGPQDIGLTSPTEVIEFHQIKDNGRVIGSVLDEKGRPLPDALMIIVEREFDFEKLKKVDGLVTSMAALDTTDGLTMLDKITSGIIDFTFTNESGEYSFLRKKSKPRFRLPYYIAMSPGRFSGMLYDNTPSCDVALDVDLELPVVRLPKIGMACGVISPPNMVPDAENPGSFQPLSEKNNQFTLTLSSNFAWFDWTQKGNLFWQYDTPQKTGTYGKTFQMPIPLGTTYTLNARPLSPGLSPPWWSKPPFMRSDRPDDLKTYKPRPLHPFLLKLEYADGSPGAEIMVSARYAPLEPHPNSGEMWNPFTDGNGMQLLYAYDRTTPAIRISNPNRPGILQTIPPRPLDSNTSVPVVLFKLDPKVWQVRGLDPQSIH